MFDLRFIPQRETTSVFLLLGLIAITACVRPEATVAARGDGGQSVHNPLSVLEVLDASIDALER